MNFELITTEGTNSSVTKIYEVTMFNQLIIKSQKTLTKSVYLDKIF